MGANADLNVLKQVILKEQFYNQVPEDLRLYLLNKNPANLLDAAKRADEYVALRKQGKKLQVDGKHNNNKESGQFKKKVYEQKRSNNVQNNSHNMSYSNRFNSDKTHIICYNCNKPGHVKKDCPHKFIDSKSIKLVQNVNDDVRELYQIEIIKRYDCCDNFVPCTGDSSQFVFPVCFYNCNDNKCVTVKGYRDSGAAVTLLMEGAVPDDYLSPLNDTVWLEFANGSRDCSQLYRANIATSGKCGDVTLGIVPNSYRFPSGAKLLIGIDMFAKSVQAVTRSQTRSANGGVDKITNGGVMDSRDIVESANSSAPSTLHENNAKVSTDIAQATEENIVDVIDSDIGNCLQALFADGSSIVGASELIDMQRNDSTLKHLLDNVKSNAINPTVNPYSIHSNGLLIRNFVDRSNKLFNESVV